MEQKAGAQISKRAFLQSALILLALMILAGILTLVLPAGEYQRYESNGRTLIDPASYTTISRTDYPIWRWFTAPVEVLWSEGNLIIITIIVFILLVSGSFAVLEKSGIINAVLAKIVNRFRSKRYTLLLIISLFFMLLGGFFGILEEIIPLVPLMIALAVSLGWDPLVGLGMSVLATNIGFSAAITNPFTIGVAQKLADLPLFSGALFRIPVFLVFYAVLAWFLLTYARRIDRNPAASFVYQETQAAEAKYKQLDLSATVNPRTGKATLVFGIFLILIVAVLFAGPFLPGLSDYTLPIVGLLFFIGGLVSGFVSGCGVGQIGKALKEGMIGLAPGIPLILMAASTKQIISSGKVIDTLLHNTSSLLQGTTPLSAVLIIFFLALLVEFFVTSAGAKAVLMMPILLPIADMVGVTRQLTVTAYCFGDGFTNLAYPTNAVLLISLGLAAVTYGKWMRFTARLWLAIFPLIALFLWIGTVIQLGPF